MANPRHTAVPYIHEDITVTIANGAAVSNAVDLKGARLVGFFTPAALTNAAFDVQTSPDNEATWYDVSSMSAISAPVSTFCAVAPSDSIGGSLIRLQGAGNEGAERTIILRASRVV
jgi:hypothetical protein